MPRTTKIRQPPKKSDRADAPGEYKCLRCGRVYNRQKGFFPVTQSPLFYKNGGWLPICAQCVDAMEAAYTEKLGDYMLAAERVCMKLDVYWNDKLFETVLKHHKNGSAIRAYFAKTNLAMYKTRTYDDTIAEAEAKQRLLAEASAQAADINDEPVVEEKPDPKDVEFWGDGFTIQEYERLNDKFRRWVGEYEDGETIDIGSETLYKQICLLELSIAKKIEKGLPTEQSVSQLDNLIGSVNAKPKQKKVDDGDSSFGNLPFGVGIKFCENTRPIPEPLPEFKDVDGVRKFVDVWLLGHLCKMLHIKNAYSKMYEEEMARLRVTKPEVDNEDDETFLYDIFADNGGSPT